jgi:hypothetical protein
MPDITMCPGHDCPLKEKCYRYTAKPCEFRQSYFMSPPYKDGKCDHYWEETQESVYNQLKSIVNGQGT